MLSIATLYGVYTHVHIDRDMQLIKSDNVLHWAKSKLGYVVQEESKQPLLMRQV